MPCFRKLGGQSLFNGVLIVLILLAWGCSDPKPKGRDQGNKNAEISLEEGVPLPSIFPHSEGWVKVSVHGLLTPLYGLDACWPCHKVSSFQEEKAPTCYSCHPLYPHEPNWI